MEINFIYHVVCYGAIGEMFYFKMSNFLLDLVLPDNCHKLLFSCFRLSRIENVNSTYNIIQ